MRWPVAGHRWVHEIQNIEVYQTRGTSLFYDCGGGSRMCVLIVEYFAYENTEVLGLRRRRMSSAPS